MILDELSAQERAEMVERLARRVVERRLESVATLFLEMHKPVCFLGGQLLSVAAPILGALFGFEPMQRLALFVQSRENVEALLTRIEEMSGERRAGAEGSG
ncbi:MAG: hypothetical protein QHJ73_00880 [Armatimonadota bacterium]|nr:hypothetical protein [Armatimonadota bacterium]